MFLPLVIYAVSGLFTLILRLAQVSISWLQGRIVFAWAALVTYPLILIAGLPVVQNMPAWAGAVQLVTFVLFVIHYWAGVRATRIRAEAT